MLAVIILQKCVSNPFTLPGVEQSTVSLHDKFRCSDIYEALVSTLRGVASDSFEGDKLSSVERQGSLKQAKYASSFLRQVSLAICTNVSGKSVISTNCHIELG